MSQQVISEMQSCDLPIPAGFRYVGFREPSMGEWALSREGEAIRMCSAAGCMDSGKVIVLEPITSVHGPDFEWPTFLARRVYIAMDSRPTLRWIMYSDERLPVYDPRTGQWSGDVICNLSHLRRAIPSLVLPVEMDASESLRWVE